MGFYRLDYINEILISCYVLCSFKIQSEEQIGLILVGYLLGILLKVWGGRQIHGLRLEIRITDFSMET